MEKLEWNKVESPYWKPEVENRRYSVVFSNWRIELKDFGGKGKPRYVLTLNISHLEDGEKYETFTPPKEFSTSSQSFIAGIRPIIDAACEHNEAEISAVVERLSDRKYRITDLNTALRPLRNRVRQ
jgi:hypothetical protein